MHTEHSIPISSFSYTMLPPVWNICIHTLMQYIRSHTPSEVVDIHMCYKMHIPWEARTACFHQCAQHFQVCDISTFGGEGEGGGVTMCANQKSLKHIQSKCQRESGEKSEPEFLNKYLSLLSKARKLSLRFLMQLTNCRMISAFADLSLLQSVRQHLPVYITHLRSWIVRVWHDAFLTLLETVCRRMCAVYTSTLINNDLVN
jgi:hypothetical protein